MHEPPGGPPDYDAPIILAITPDSGSVNEGFDDAVEVSFDEVIDERSGSALENLVLLSPRPEALNVSWKRSRITVRPKGGWRENAIYHLTLLPGFADLRNNRLDSGRTVIFSTGGEIPDTRLSGTIVDWEAGRSAPRALIEAVLLPDSLAYVASADSLGDFELRHLTRGSYLVFATVDQNNNRMRDPREVFDSATVRLDSTFAQVLWAFAHDTVGPRISEVSNPDSATIRIEFAQKLVPGEPPDGAVKVYALPDTTLVQIVSVWNQPTYDSVRTVEAAADSVRQAAAADSIAAAAAEAADTLGVEATDSLTEVAADSAGAEARRGRVAEVAEVMDSLAGRLVVANDSTGQTAEDSVAADTSRAMLLLSERPALSSSWYVRLASGMLPGARYLVMAIAENLSGAIAESQGILILPEPADTVLVPADTT